MMMMIEKIRDITIDVLNKKITKYMMKKKIKRMGHYFLLA